jgi:hypothetical protein
MTRVGANQVLFALALDDKGRSDAQDCAVPRRQAQRNVILGNPHGDEPEPAVMKAARSSPKKVPGTKLRKTN